MEKVFAMASVPALLAVIILSGCVQQQNTASTDLEGMIEVMAPGYYTQLKIDNAGFMNFTKDIGMEHIVDKNRMQQSQLAELKELVRSSNFFSLNDSYADMSVDNGTTYILDLRLGNQSNRVTCYEKCPDSAVSIRNKVQEYWGSRL